MKITEEILTELERYAHERLAYGIRINTVGKSVVALHALGYTDITVDDYIAYQDHGSEDINK